MEEAERSRKKIAEAEALRGVSPSRTLQMGFDLIRATRMLSEASDRAQR